MKTLKHPIFKYSARSILVSLFLLFLGIVIMIKADSILFWVIKIIGAVLLIDSVIRFIGFLRLDAEERSINFDIVRSLVEAVLGLVAIINSSSVVTLLYIFAGILVIIEGILHLQFVLSQRRILDHWIPNFIISIFSVVVGVFIIANPLMTGKYVNMFIGIEIIVTALISLCGYIYFLVFLRSYSKADKVYELDESLVEEVE